MGRKLFTRICLNFSPDYHGNSRAGEIAQYLDHSGGQLIRTHTDSLNLFLFVCFLPVARFFYRYYNTFFSNSCEIRLILPVRRRNGNENLLSRNLLQLPLHHVDPSLSPLCIWWCWSLLFQESICKSLPEENVVTHYDHYPVPDTLYKKTRKSNRNKDKNTSVKKSPKLILHIFSLYS